MLIATPIEEVRRGFSDSLRSCEVLYAGNKDRIFDLAAKTSPSEQKPFVRTLQPVSFPIPDQDWKISFEAPVLFKIYEWNRLNTYKYQGATPDFSATIEVGPPKCQGGNTHSAAVECFNSQFNWNQNTAKESISTQSGNDWHKIEYDVLLPKSGNVEAHHIHFLSVYRDKWIHIHISGTDKSAMERFEKSLRYDEQS